MSGSNYPEPICMMCGQYCDRSEEADVGGGPWELWCYCDECDVETFHPIPPADTDADRATGEKVFVWGEPKESK